MVLGLIRRHRESSAAVSVVSDSTRGQQYDVRADAQRCTSYKGKGRRVVAEES
jgi:hypothetical protein